MVGLNFKVDSQYSALLIVNLFTISIDFNQFQSISITFNPKFKWGLGLDRKSHILGGD